jgi:hypothetical protein
MGSAFAAPPLRLRVWLAAGAGVGLAFTLALLQAPGVAAAGRAGLLGAPLLLLAVEASLYVGSLVLQSLRRWVDWRWAAYWLGHAAGAAGALAFSG